MNSIYSGRILSYNYNCIELPVYLYSVHRVFGAHVSSACSYVYGCCRHCHATPSHRGKEMHHYVSSKIT